MNKWRAVLAGGVVSSLALGGLVVPRVMAAELQPNISIAKCDLIRDLNHSPQQLVDRPTSLNGALQASYEGTPEAGKPFTVNITYPEVGVAKTANHAVKALRLKKHQVTQ